VAALEEADATRSQAAALIQSRVRANSQRIRGGRPIGLPASTEETLVEGYLTKRGSAFPYTWKRRYTTIVQQMGMLRLCYFEAHSNARNSPPPSLKGECLVHGVKALPHDPVGLAFDVYEVAGTPAKTGPRSSSSQDGRRSSRFSFLAGGSGGNKDGAKEARELVAQFDSTAERDRWISAVADHLDAHAPTSLPSRSPFRQPPQAGISE